MPEIGLGGLLLDRPYSGTAVYSRNLAQWLPRVAPDLDFRLFTRRAEVDIQGVSVESVRTPFDCFDRGGGPTARLDKIVWETMSLPLHAWSRKERLIHSLYFAAPPLASCPVVVTIHDLVPLLLPGYHRTRQAAAYSAFMAMATRRAAAIITVSEHSRDDIIRLLRVPADRVHITPEAADQRFQPVQPAAEIERVRTAYRLPRRFVLYLGGAEKRKNLETLVRAWAAIGGEAGRQDTQLVIVARFPPPDALYPDIPGLVRELGLEESTTLVPEVSEADKPYVMAAALALAFPSKYEGFGLPPLEAMASGTPVIASRATSLPEVVGEGGILLDPDDAGAWSRAMLDIICSEEIRSELREQGLRQAERFSWRRTAEETVAVYRSLLT